MLLEELEHVDHILEEQGVSLVKLDNPIAALEMFNVDIIPAIVHYQFKQPHFYNGDLTNEKKIVKWVLDIRENAWSLAYELVCDQLDTKFISTLYTQSERFFGNLQRTWQGWTIK